MGMISCSSGPPTLEPVWRSLAAEKQLSSSPFLHLSLHSVRFFGSHGAPAVGAVVGAGASVATGTTLGVAGALDGAGASGPAPDAAEQPAVSTKLARSRSLVTCI